MTARRQKNRGQKKKGMDKSFHVKRESSIGLRWQGHGKGEKKDNREQEGQSKKVIEETKWNQS